MERIDDCLSFNKLLEFVEGNLTENEKRNIQSHISKCNECNTTINSIKNYYNRTGNSKDQLFNKLDKFEKELAKIPLTNQKQSRKKKLLLVVKSISSIAAAILIWFFIGITNENFYFPENSSQPILLGVIEDKSKVGFAEKTPITLSSEKEINQLSKLLSVNESGLVSIPHSEKELIWSFSDGTTAKNDGLPIDLFLSSEMVNQLGISNEKQVKFSVLMIKKHKKHAESYHYQFNNEENILNIYGEFNIDLVFYEEEKDAYFIKINDNNNYYFKKEGYGVFPEYVLNELQIKIVE